MDPLASQQTLGALSLNRILRVGEQYLLALGPTGATLTGEAAFSAAAFGAAAALPFGVGTGAGADGGAEAGAAADAQDRTEVPLVAVKL